MRLARSTLLQAAFLTVVSIASLASLYEHKLNLVERSAIGEGKGVFALFKCGERLSNSTEPIVVADVHSFYILHHYGDPAITRRLVYLSDYNSMASVMSQGMHDSAAWRVEDYRTFTSRSPNFLLYESQFFANQIRSPLLARVAADHGTITDGGCLDPRDRYPRPGQLFRVAIPDPPVSARQRE
jgi:hypothetical protein